MYVTYEDVIFFLCVFFFCESEMQEIRVTKILQNPTTKLLALD